MTVGSESVAVSGVDSDQFQALQKRARFGDELNVAASRTRQDGMSGASRGQADTHQLIAFEPLFTAQAADSFLIRVGRDAARHLDGWLHRFLESGSRSACVGRSFPSGMSLARQVYQALAEWVTAVRLCGTHKAYFYDLAYESQNPNPVRQRAADKDGAPGR
jgi:hypothetical protein